MMPSDQGWSYSRAISSNLACSTSCKNAALATWSSADAVPLLVQRLAILSRTVLESVTVGVVDQE